MVPDYDWQLKALDLAVVAAKENYHDVFELGKDAKPSGNAASTNDSTAAAIPPFETCRITSGYWIRNPLRRAPSVPNARFSTNDDIHDAKEKLHGAH